jgi:hypothetical protein
VYSLTWCSRAAFAGGFINGGAHEARGPPVGKEDYGGRFGDDAGPASDPFICLLTAGLRSHLRLQSRWTLTYPVTPMSRPRIHTSVCILGHRTVSWGSLELECIKKEFERKHWESLRTFALERARQTPSTRCNGFSSPCTFLDRMQKKRLFFLCHFILAVPPGALVNTHIVNALQRLDPASRRHHAGPLLSFPEALL